MTYSTLQTTCKCSIRQPTNKKTKIGAGSGIGLAVAKRLVADGIKHLALIDLTLNTLTAASTSLTEIDSSVTILPLAIDVSKEEQVETAVTQTVEKFGRIDVCLNAAGIAGKSAGVAELEVGDLDEVLGVNLKGVWFCERAQIRQFLKQEMRDLRCVFFFLISMS